MQQKVECDKKERKRRFNGKKRCGIENNTLKKIPYLKIEILIRVSFNSISASVRWICVFLFGIFVAFRQTQDMHVAHFSKYINLHSKKAALKAAHTNT